MNNANTLQRKVSQGSQKKKSEEGSVGVEKGNVYSSSCLLVKKSQVLRQSSFEKQPAIAR
jgi:hypothetical protein